MAAKIAGALVLVMLFVLQSASAEARTAKPRAPRPGQGTDMAVTGISLRPEFYRPGDL